MRIDADWTDIPHRRGPSCFCASRFRSTSITRASMSSISMNFPQWANTLSVTRARSSARRTPVLLDVEDDATAAQERLVQLIDLDLQIELT